MRARSYLRVGIAIAAVSLTTCTPPGNWIKVRSDREQPDAASFLRMIGLPVPTATVELYEYAPGLDDSAEVKLVMSEAEWATMKNAPALRMNADGPKGLILTGLLSSDHGDWRPQADGATIVAHRDLPDAEILTVGYSPAGPGRVRVYLFWHET